MHPSSTEDSGQALAAVDDRDHDGPSSGAAPPGLPPLFVACLCAAWCRVCEEYRPAIGRVAGEFPGHRFIDLDIEDHEALVDGLEIEQFPTFLMASGDEVRFFGPLPPQADALRRTVRAATAAACMATDAVQLAAWRRIRGAIDRGEL